MGMRAADKRDIHRAGQFDVGDELAAPVQMPVILPAQQRRADAKPVVRHWAPPSQFLGRLGDRGDDVGIAGAAADIAGEALADLTLRPRALPQDQIARGDQHCRRAIPALQCVVLVKVAAQRLDDRVAGEALDGRDLALVAGDGEHQARARRLAVDEDRAGAAHAVLAAEMSAGQIAPLAQKIGQ